MADFLFPLLLFGFIVAYTAYLTYRAYKSEAFTISSSEARRAIKRALAGGVLGFSAGFSFAWLNNYLTDFMPDKVNPYIMVLPEMGALFIGWFVMVIGAFIGVVTTNIRLTKKAMLISAILLLLGSLAYFNIHEDPLPNGVQADRIFIDKSKRNLYLLKGEAVLKRYHVSLGSEPIGKKTMQGDKKTPEGVYFIDSRNAVSNYHLSLHISYPNESDIANANNLGVSPGGDVTIHGIKNGFCWLGRAHRLFDWTQGCIAVTNNEIEEVWRAVPDGTPIIIVP